ncbi:MAG: TrkA family potassium uptake protein [Anaerolineae bacterium]|nr:TrkA family potassium uptake protein [Anaerolineae bacterium]
MRVIIVGGGKLGEGLARLLMSEGHPITVIESRSDHAAVLRHDLPAAVVVMGNGTDPDVLEAAGIRRTDLVAAVTGADETNLVVTSLARQEFNVHRVIARVNNPKNAWLFTPEMGCDVAVNQAEVMAKLIIEGM